MVLTRRWRTGLLLLGMVFATGVLLWRPQAVAGGISRGLSICSTVLIPSLFPFLVLCGFLTRSGVASAVGRRLEGVTRRLFGLPGCCATGILVASVGGYPAGGVSVGELVRSGQIDREEGRRMLRFCVNGGPGFVISAVGAGLMGNVWIGVFLFAASMIASLVIGIVSAPRSRRGAVRRIKPQETPPSATVALVDSVTAACETVLYMCGFVLLFSAALTVWDVMAVGENAWQQRVYGALVACVLEVSSGCAAAAALPENAMWFLGFAIGFGGLSVHCQLAASLRGLNLIDRRFFASRLAHGVLTSVIVQLLLKYIPLPQTVGGALQQPVVEAFYGSAAITAALLVLGGVWMLTVGHLDKTT